MAQIQVKCKYCKKMIFRNNAYSHPNKSRNYYCNEECYKKEEQLKKDKKINTTANTLVTCRCCGKRIYKLKAFCVKDRYYYCSEDEYISKYKGSDAYWEEMFLDYIYYDITSKQCDYIMIQRQAEMYHDKEHYKWSGMYLALVYWWDTMHNDWNPEWGLGQIFPKAYEDAKLFYHQKKEIEQLMENIKEDKIVIIKKKKILNNLVAWEDL